MMTVDWTLNIGHILTMAGVVCGGMAFLYAVRYDIRLLATRLAGVEERLEKLADVVVTAARQDERIDALDRRLNVYDLNKKPRNPSSR